RPSIFKTSSKILRSSLLIKNYERLIYRASMDFIGAGNYDKYLLVQSSLSPRAYERWIKLWRWKTVEMILLQSHFILKSYWLKCVVNCDEHMESMPRS